MSKYVRYFILVVVLAIAAGIINYQKSLPRGLDIAGGIRVVLEVDPKKPSDWPVEYEKRMDKLAAIRTTINNRVKGLQGVSEALVFVQGDNRVVVELPGISDPDKALETIRSTASLEFYYLKDVSNENNPQGEWRMSQSMGSGGAKEAYLFTSLRGETVDSEKQPQEVLDKVVKANDPKNAPILTGEDLSPNSKPTIDNQSQRAIVEIQFNDNGAKKFEEFTRGHVKDVLAVFFDGKLLTAPEIESVIKGGKAIITGFKGIDEAQRVSSLINAGALPVPLKVVDRYTVEPTLGIEVMNQVVTAGIAGLILVVLFMLLYYRLPGLIASVALCLYALFVLAVFKLINATMSLAGIAALIISIGMAVDANILIFERLKEELRSGKTLHAAIDAGFNRAFTAIFDSNMCSAITCAILMWYGSPSVQSFAFTLLIGVAISMFTAIIVTRSILHVVVTMDWATKPALFGLGTSWMAKAGVNIDIVGKRAWWFVLSGIFILPGIVVLLMPGGGLKPNIEFMSGTEITAKFDKPAKLADVRAAVKPFVIKNVEVQMADKETVAFIKTDITRDAVGKVENPEVVVQQKVDDIKKALDEKFEVLKNTEIRAVFESKVSAGDVQKAVDMQFPKSNVSLSGQGAIAVITTGDLRAKLGAKFDEKMGALKSELGKIAKVSELTDEEKPAFSQFTVEPVVSAELVQNAIWSVIFASIAIVLYLTIRFAIGGLMEGLKYGVCAVIALIHDTLFIIGMFAILGKVAGWEVGSLFVTAVLTVIGFSVHDTIVVFDRIRENLRHRLRGESFEQLANRSILQTFSRSINTSLTVILTLVTLILFGGPMLRQFYVAMLAGIIIGTYSSIFNATQLVVVWNNLGAKTSGGKKQSDDKAMVDTPMKSAIDLNAEAPVAEQPEAGVQDKKPASARIKKKRRF